MTISQNPLTSAAQGAASAPALQMRDVHCHFDRVQAVAGISLDISPGEVLCLLGPSGCGKTTLLRIAAGLQKLTAGEVSLDNETVASADGLHQPPEKRNVGLAFQDSALFPHLSVLDNVTFGLGHLPKAERRQQALRLLGQLGMAEFAPAYPHTLSGGQQQRVALARALAPSPRVMLLDEPFSSLDARLRDQIRDDTLHVLKSLGAATLLVTHDPEEAMFMADRIALMRQGRIVQVGTPMELYCFPADPFVVRFFGQVNEVPGVVRDGLVATPVGNVAAVGLEDGTDVTVMIRPEAIRVTVLDAAGDDQHKTSHVLVSRLLGPSSLLHICGHGQSGEERHLHARVPGVCLPAPGQPVSLDFDPAQVFVFPVG